MLRRASLVLTLAAWLLATGSHWDLVQVYGWGRMIADYSRSMTLTRAVKKTFSGEEMCGVCVAVHDARQQRDAADAKVPGTKVTAKIFLVGAPNGLVFVSPAPVCVGLTPIAPDSGSTPRAAPLLTPPRVAA